MPILTRRSVLGSLAISVLPLPVRAEDAPPADQSAPKQSAEKPAEPAASPDGFKILEARKAALRLAPEPASLTEVWTYDGTLPGPLLRYKKGEEVKIRLHNKLDQPTSIHWHGMRIANAMDGAAGLTQDPVAPGASFDYRFTPPDSGFYWYHPDIAAHGAEQQGRGLAGVLIVDEVEPPKVDRDMLIVVSDWKLDAKAAIDGDFQNTAEAAGQGRTGPLLTLNGDAATKVETLPPGSRLRLRILNVALARFGVLSFVGGKPWVIGIDGQPCEPFEPARRSLPIGPGARFDVILDLPAEASSESNLVLHMSEGDQTLLTWKTAGEAAADKGPQPSLADNPLLPAEIHLERSTKFDLVIEGGLKGPGMDAPPQPKAKTAIAARKPERDPLADPAHIWTINGLLPDARNGKPLFSVKRGSPVTLGFINKTAFIQQMHLHGHVVRLLHDLDDGWEPYWRDSVLIPEGRAKHVAFVADNPGKWAIESAMPQRAASGLWAWFEVI